MGRSWNPPRTLPSVSVISKSAVKFIKNCDSPFVRLDMIGLYENPTGSEYNTIFSPGANVFDKPHILQQTQVQQINQVRRQMFRWR
jgi:hypothetical protein